MADVTIEGAIGANAEINFQYGPVWTSDNNGYVFFTDTDNSDIAYRKTTDGGATWGSAVQIDTDAGGSAIYRFCIWHDQWTPGDSGTKIHITWNYWATDAVKYRNLDTSSDTLSSAVSIFTAGSYTPNTASWVAFNISITKAQGGNLYVHAVSSTNLVFYRSTDGGSTWSSRTSPGESVIDVALLMPADTTDTQDICCIFDDVSANAISLKMYDDSANTWTETAITSMTDNALANNFNASVRHSDQHILLAFWNAYDATTADLLTYDLTVNSIASPTVTAKTNVLTDSAESNMVCVFIDQATDDVYVGYLKGGTWTATVGVFYKKSTDDMATWGSETTFDEGTDDDYRQVSAGLGIKSGQSGRFYLVWHDDDDNDLFGNKVNSVAITAGGGSVTGTLAFTNADDTMSASGAETFTGTLAFTNAGDTMSATGAETFTGTLAFTNASDTMSASGAEIFTGTLAFTNAADTMSASGTVIAPVTGTLAFTNASDTMSASGTAVAPITGTLAITNAGDTMSATGFTFTDTLQLADDTMYVRGYVTEAGTGSFIVTIEADTMAVRAWVTELVTGSLVVALNNDECLMRGTVDEDVVGAIP